MPKYVDHDARRRFIAATAAELVATRGLDALTFRNVAVAAGSSTTVVTHYFADKRELLLWTFQMVAERSGARFDAARERGGGVLACVESLLPLDRERQRDWRLLTCYWGMAISDAELAEAQARHVRSGQQRIEVLLRERYPDRDRRELTLVAARLVAVVNGLGAHHALDPGHWSAVKQRAIIRSELGSLE